MASNGVPVKKRMAAARPAAHAPLVDEDAPPALNTIKKSKRASSSGSGGASSGRHESEFVSVEVGLRELHKRMATSSGAMPTKRATVNRKANKDGTAEAVVESLRAKKSATSRKKIPVQGVNGERLETTTTTTPKQRAPAKAKAATAKSTGTVPAKKSASTVTTAGNRTAAAAGIALAAARAAAMQQQQDRVQQRVLDLQRTADPSADKAPHAAVHQETPVVVKIEAPVSPLQQLHVQQEQAPAAETSTLNLDMDTTQSSQGFIEEDFDEDLVFLQALEEVERRLQPTTISGVVSSDVPISSSPKPTADTHPSPNTSSVPSFESSTAIIKPELASPPASFTSTTPTLPPAMLAEYERLKRENEALRRSNDMLQAGKVAMPQDTSVSCAGANNGSATSQSASPLVSGNGNVEPNPTTSALVDTSSDFATVDEETDGTLRRRHQEMEPSLEAVVQSALTPGEHEAEDEDMKSEDGEGDHDQDMDSANETIDYGHNGEDDCMDKEEEEDDDDEEENEEQERDDQDGDQNGSSVENRVSTIDRGNYSEYRAIDRTEIDEEDDTKLSHKAVKPHITNSAPRVTAMSQKRPSKASPPMAPQRVATTGSETESDQELQVIHKHRSRAAALSESSSSSSSSSEESGEENAEASAGGSNVLEAALRAATGRAPAKVAAKDKTVKRPVGPPTHEPRVSPQKRLRVDTKLEEHEDASPSTAPVEESVSANRKAKKRRAAGATTLSAKDKSTLMWPTLDAFYDFVLELTPRRVLHSDPLHLQLLRAYEKARVRLPMHYSGITQYCDVQLESIVEELLSSVRNAEELSLHNSSRTRLWLASISPCSTNTSHSTTVKKSTSVPALNSNVIFMESGFSGTSAAGKSDFIVTFQDKRGSGPHQKSALSDFVGGDLLAMRSPQWRDYDIYAFGIVLCSSVVAVGGTSTSSRDGGGSSSSSADQLCVLVRAPSATADDLDAASHFASVMEMCLVNEGAAQWSWSLEQVHNLTTSAREFQAIQSVRFFKPETKEMLMSGIIPEIMKTEQTQIVEPRKKLTSGLYEALETKYNPSQMQAILGAISDDSSISIIQGPPGTGKTKTILGVLSALLDGAALTASRQAQAKSRIRIGASLEQKRPSAAHDKKSVAQESIHVLVAAPSNAAVDELIVRLLSEGVYDARKGKSYRPRIVRVGRPESLQQQQQQRPSGADDFTRKKKWRKYASEVEEILLETLVNKNKSAFPTAKQARQTIIQNAQIVFCTLSGAGSVAMCELQSQHFDALVIDEAAQAVEASLLIPFKFQPSRVVLVGDHRQLPATVISKRLIELGYDRSLFQRLVENGSRVFMLTQQYRMHPEISWFPSTYFYNSKLIEAPQMKEWTARKYHRDSLFRPFLFFDVISGQQSQVAGSKSLRNVNEIECILQLLTRLVVEKFPELEWKRRIGIIAPYKQQIYELRNELQRWEKQHDKRLDIEVNTVDGFQGREKEVIIYSCVRTGRAGQGRSSSRQNGQTIEAFWADERRMNVAITRAKSSLWIIGNSTLLKQSVAWRALITHAKDSRRYILDEELLGSQHQRSAESANSHGKSRDGNRNRDRSRDRSGDHDGGDRRSRDHSQSRGRRS